MQRSALALVLACGASLIATLVAVGHWNAKATARLNTAAQRLAALTIHPADDGERAAISWGYAERLRLGLESPFRLVEEASRDPRLGADERHTVAWALLAHVVRGESYTIDPAALDGLGPMQNGRSATGEQHIALMERAITRADNPRVGELGVRIAYTLAATERLVDASGPILAAEAAAMLADREIARREARNVVQSARGADPIDVVRGRRQRHGFYVERPVLLAPTPDIEDAAVQLAGPLLDSLRSMRPSQPESSQHSSDIVAALAPALFAAGQRVPPTASLVVTVERHLPTLRSWGRATGVDVDAIAKVRNAEMLVAATSKVDTGRAERRAIGRLMVASSVAMRSLAQEPVWFATDTTMDAASTAAALGLADITFDHDVPTVWQPYSLRSLANAIADVRRVFPALDLRALHVRFRMNAPADSALAMHDPRTRTLHLPVLTWAGTLSHELAHDIDRQSAQQLGIAGYRSDIVARVADSDQRVSVGGERLAASLRALTEELSQTPNAARAIAERPAEIFATRVDWFVAQALARQGISDGFLSAVQDELLTGHVVHPERLQGSARSRSLLTALEAMTTVSPFAREEPEPSVQTLLRWSLAVPVDRRVAVDILQGEWQSWMPAPLLGGGQEGDQHGCRDLDARAALVRMAAESRARGWLRLRSRWTPENQRTPLARAVLGQAPWSDALATARVDALRDYVLLELESGMELPAGLGAYAAQLANRARCR